MVCGRIRTASGASPVGGVNDSPTAGSGRRDCGESISNSPTSSTAPTLPVSRDNPCTRLPRRAISTLVDLTRFRVPRWDYIDQRLSVHQPVAVRVRDGLRPVAYPRLGEQVVH